MIHPFYLGSAFAVVALLGLSGTLLLSSKKPMPITAKTRSMIDSDDKSDLVLNLLRRGYRISIRDLIAIYWDSRFLVSRVHSEWTRLPHDEVTSELVRMQEEAHDRTKRYLVLHLLERVGIHRREDASQVYSIFLLHSFGEEASIVTQLAEYANSEALLMVVGAI